MRLLASSSTSLQPRTLTAFSVAAPTPLKNETEVTLRTWDVLCGQDKRYNLRLGNMKFQEIVDKMRKHFYARSSKTGQKKLIREIEDFVQGYGGRFVRVDDSTGNLRLMTMAESRNKIGRTLRENPSPSKIRRVYVTEVKELDVLCGRGERCMFCITCY